MEICNKEMPRAKNGNNRGKCNKVLKHDCKCSNGTCCFCGVSFTLENSPPSVFTKQSGLCRSCRVVRQRELNGWEPRHYQICGKEYTFPCGCRGVLPLSEGDVDKFVIWNKTHWKCRAAYIILSNFNDSKRFGYLAIDLKTSHSFLRQLMENPNCVLCSQTLKWEFGRGKTPHLHHDHETGKIYGFTHVHCNPRALENEIVRLKKEIKNLKEQRFRNAEQTAPN